MYWINGQLAEFVPLNDRSFQYGDGCFTTVLTRNGEPVLWDYHLDRMQQALARLAIDEPDWKQIYDWVTEISYPESQAGIKIHISRGQGGRGYSPKDIHNPLVTISRFHYPTHYLSWQQSGVELVICETKLGLNPLLAGMKHNNRLEQVLIKHELEERQAIDGIVLDLNDNVIETSMANIFWVKDNILYTPSLTMSGVSGVMRRHIIQLAQQASLTIKEETSALSAVMNADEIFMSNSLLGIAPVIQIAGTSQHSISQYSIGPVTKFLQERIVT